MFTHQPKILLNGHVTMVNKFITVSRTNISWLFIPIQLMFVFFIPKKTTFIYSLFQFSWHFFIPIQLRCNLFFIPIQLIFISLFFIPIQLYIHFFFIPIQLMFISSLFQFSWYSFILYSNSADFALFFTATLWC